MTDIDLQEIKDRLISIQAALDVLLETDKIMLEKVKIDPDKSDLAQRLLLRIHTIEGQMKPYTQTVSRIAQMPPSSLR